MFRYTDIVEHTIFLDSLTLFRTTNAIYRGVVMDRLLKAKKLPPTWKLTRESGLVLGEILGDIRIRARGEGCYPKRAPRKTLKQFFLERYLIWMKSKTWTAVFEGNGEIVPEPETFQKVFGYKDLVKVTVCCDNLRQFKTTNQTYRRTVMQRLLKANNLPLTMKLTKSSDLELGRVLNSFQTRFKSKFDTSKNRAEVFLERYTEWMNTRHWTAVFEANYEVSDVNSEVSEINVEESEEVPQVKVKVSKDSITNESKVDDKILDIRRSKRVKLNNDDAKTSLEHVRFDTNKRKLEHKNNESKKPKLSHADADAKTSPLEKLSKNIQLKDIGIKIEFEEMDIKQEPLAYTGSQVNYENGTIKEIIELKSKLEALEAKLKAANTQNENLQTENTSLKSEIMILKSM